MEKGIEEPKEDYGDILKDAILGKKDAFTPFLLKENSLDTMTNTKENLKGLDSYAVWWGEQTLRAINQPEQWKKAMDEAFCKGGMIDGISANHCVRVALDGEYDELTCVPGDGERMLAVMHGEYEKWDQLSDLSKAAASSRMILEHPGLFNGPPEIIAGEARRLGLDLSNPVYSAAKKCFASVAEPLTVNKLDQAKDYIAEDKLKEEMKNAPIPNPQSP